MQTKEIALGIVDRTKCTGCLACVDICARKAIVCSNNEEGFVYPTINADKCVGCGMCSKVCPAKDENAQATKNLSPKSVFSGKAKDEALLQNVSSGGAVPAIVKTFCENSEFSVYGVKFDSSMMLTYTEIRSYEKLTEIRGSKYVQADSLSVYLKIKKSLEEGRRTVFCGTPCCVSALKRFLSVEYDDLLCVDFICSGVPSPAVFKSFIEQQSLKYGKRIVNMTFREKSRLLGLSTSFGSIIFFDDGTSVQFKRPTSYMRSFLRHAMLRPSCHLCNFASLERTGDITVGDFWGIDKYDSDISEGDGISLIMPNSKKGINLCGKLGTLMKMKEFSVLATKKNTPLYKSTASFAKRDVFIREAIQLGFAESYKRNIGNDSIKKRMVAFVTRPLPYSIRNRIIEKF